MQSIYPIKKNGDRIIIALITSINGYNEVFASWQQNNEELQLATIPPSYPCIVFASCVTLQDVDYFCAEFIYIQDIIDVYNKYISERPWCVIKYKINQLKSIYKKVK